MRVTLDHPPPRIPPGFMTREERKKFENLNSSYNKYWVPCVWFSSLAAQARREGRIRDNSALKLLLEVSQRGSHRYHSRNCALWNGSRVTDLEPPKHSYQVHLFPCGQPCSAW